MIFLTGGTGLLGSHLILDLLLKGRSVRASYRSQEGLSMVKKVFCHYSDAGLDLFNKVEWVKGDLSDNDFIYDQIEGCEVVYHVAGYVSFSRRDFTKLINVNKIGTETVVNACLYHKVPKLAYVSSTAAVGTLETKDVYTEDEKWKSDAVNSGYSISKFSAEREVWRGVAEGLDACIINPSIILGPGDWDRSSIKILKTIKKGLKFYTEGANNFVDVRDVSKALIFLEEQGIVNERFLIAGHHSSFFSLFEKISKEFGVAPPKYKVGKLAGALAWRISGLNSFFTGKAPLLTKDSVKSSFEKKAYSSDKYLQASGANFYDLHDTLGNTVAFLKKNYS